MTWIRRSFGQSIRRYPRSEEMEKRFEKAPFKETCKLYAEYFPEIPKRKYRAMYVLSKQIPKSRYENETRKED